MTAPPRTRPRPPCRARIWRPVGVAAWHRQTAAVSAPSSLTTARLGLDHPRPGRLAVQHGVDHHRAALSFRVPRGDQRDQGDLSVVIASAVISVAGVVRTPRLRPTTTCGRLPVSAAATVPGYHVRAPVGTSRSVRLGHSHSARRPARRATGLGQRGADLRPPIPAGATGTRSGLGEVPVVLGLFLDVRRVVPCLVQVPGLLMTAIPLSSTAACRRSRTHRALHRTEHVTFLVSVRVPSLSLLRSAPARFHVAAHRAPPSERRRPPGAEQVAQFVTSAGPLRARRRRPGDPLSRISTA